MRDDFVNDLMVNAYHDGLSQGWWQGFWAAVSACTLVVSAAIAGAALAL